MSYLEKQHWKVVKWTIRYLKGTLDTCLCSIANDFKLKGFVDADLTIDINSKNNSRGYVFILDDTAVLEDSNFQKVVTLPPIEAEYVCYGRSRR